MDIAEIVDPVSDDLASVNRLITERLRSDVVLIDQLAHYIIDSGGKRLRPLLVLLAARACGYSGTGHIQLAAIVEFIHTATLLHDDVVDDSGLRRGQETANAVWGNEASVLVGDFLYSRAFEMMVELDNMRILEILAQATNTIAEGEVLQLMNVHNPDTSEEQYLRVILSKTAKLFEAGAQTGAVIAGSAKTHEQALANFGLHLGAAFQLIDDVLDYSASTEETGKNLGDDLAEGKPTMPLIYAMEHGLEEDAAYVRRAIEEGGRDRIEGVLKAVQETDAIEYTRTAAQRESDKALQVLSVLPASRFRRSLEALARFSIDRTH